MNRMKFPDIKNQALKSGALQAAGLLACFAALLFIVCYFGNKPAARFYDRLLIDFDDMNAYFRASRWIGGHGVLYLDYRSDYPFLANMLFGLAGCMAVLLSGVMQEFKAFCWVWCCLSLSVYFFAVKKIVAARPARLVFWIIFAPSTLYFVLYRYDIYPAVCCLLSLLALKEDKPEKSALWLGVSVALKGYALVLVPSLLIYLFYRTGLRRTFRVLCLVFAPLIVCSLIMITWGGMDVFLTPYLFQAGRRLSGESSYYSLFFLLQMGGFSAGSVDFWAGQIIRFRIPLILQCVSFAVIPVILRPRNWNELLEIWLFCILGFISFSVFNSPQFLIWVAVPACLLPVSLPLIGIIIFALMNYFYFPAGFDLMMTSGGEFNAVFMMIILEITVLRFLIMAGLLRRRIRSNPAQASPG